MTYYYNAYTARGNFVTNLTSPPFFGTSPNPFFPDLTLFPFRPWPHLLSSFHDVSLSVPDLTRGTASYGLFPRVTPSHPWIALAIWFHSLSLSTALSFYYYYTVTCDTASICCYFSLFHLVFILPPLKRPPCWDFKSGRRNMERYYLYYIWNSTHQEPTRPGNTGW